MIRLRVRDIDSGLILTLLEGIVPDPAPLAVKLPVPGRVHRRLHRVVERSFFRHGREAQDGRDGGGVEDDQFSGA